MYVDSIKGEKYLPSRNILCQLTPNHLPIEEEYNFFMLWYNPVVFHTIFLFNRSIDGTFAYLTAYDGILF